ncbi:hypothetical protein BC628DRAFT_1417779 [Trametes gibbosa]|nr:hypothetical protein BC628DRAFT_1421818 [Trametes gibbosa]KAI0828190.1 hypothetical protein BC628DRAFT_1417779 [Trametes gibbosa]
MVRAPTKKELEERVEQLIQEIEALQIARDDAARALQAAEGTVQAQQGELVAARAQADAAEEAATQARADADAARQLQAQLQAQLEAAAAAQPPAGPGGQDSVANLPEIPRPAGSGWSIREAMELDHPDYAEIQRSIRSLVIRSQLDWTDDFRRQDPDKLATFFRAARKAHPVLRRYMNNWAAAIARQYMQNKRKHAYRQGYIKKRPAPGDQAGNGPRRDGGGGMNGGGALAA